MVITTTTVRDTIKLIRKFGDVEFPEGTRIDWSVVNSTDQDMFELEQKYGVTEVGSGLKQKLIIGL